jgi:hypothetical protein
MRGRCFDAAWRAGERAWKRGTIAPASLRVEAARRARAYAKRHEYPSPRAYARAVLDYGDVFMGAWLAAGYEQADADGDTALLDVLNDLATQRFAYWP